MGRFYSEKTITFINWLKALALSPGVLFSVGYLVIYLLTNVYLNSALKSTILQEIETATENRYTISVEHLRAGIDLQSVTLRNLEFVPVTNQNLQGENSSISLPNLYVEQVNLCNLLFSRKCVEHSTREISRHILCINHLLVLSFPQ
jgi:hypothetical protein